MLVISPTLNYLGAMCNHRMGCILLAFSFLTAFRFTPTSKYAASVIQTVWSCKNECGGGEGVEGRRHTQTHAHAVCRIRLSGELIVNRYVAESITIDAGRFGHIGVNCVQNQFTRYRQRSNEPLQHHRIRLSIING